MSTDPTYKLLSDSNIFKQQQQTEVTALAGKADAAALTIGLTSKADATATTAALATKANSSDVTTGLGNKPDRYPTVPASMIASDCNELFAGFSQRFYDSTNNRLIPCRGLGGANSGIPDQTLPDSSGTKLSPWIWAMEIRAFAERARQTKTTTAIARVQNAWNYFKTQFSTTQLTSTIYSTNQLYGLADDAAAITNAFMDVWDISGDTTAVQIAIEAHACAFIMFQDTRSQNPIVSYTAKTPGGLTLQRNTYGHLYDQSKGLNDGSSCHEMFLAICAWRIAQVPDATIAAFYSTNGLASAQAYKAALLNQAKDTWSWAVQFLRWPGSTGAIAGIYGSLMILNPNASDFHQLEAIASKGTTKRGFTSFADHGTVAAIVLSDMLYTTTSQAQYLTEMQSALVAYPTLTTGFGRTFKGLPCYVNSQDPFTDGIWHAEATRRLLARYPTPTDYSAFKLAVLGTAKIIASQSGNGSISPNWGPPELSNGGGCFIWEQDSANAGDGEGGNQADGRQAMTASSSMLVVLAANLLATTEATIGSGMNSGAIEILPSQVVASLAAAQNAQFNPFKHLGPYFSVRGSLNTKTGHLLINDVDQLQVSPNGVDIWLGASTHGDHYLFGNVYSVNNGIQIMSSQFSNQFYLGKPGGMAGLNLASGTYINGNSAAIYLGIANSPIVSVTSSSATVNSQLNVTQDIRPVYDNVQSLGSPGTRWAGIYLGNNPNVTSDGTTKTQITSFTSDELAAARAIAKLLTKFKNEKAVADKGDNARWHSGAIAQAVVQELQKRDLITTPASEETATDIPYDWVGYDTWDARPAQEAVIGTEEISHLEEVTTSSGKNIEVRVVDVPGIMAVEAQPAIAAGGLYSIRYEPLLVWIAAAHEAGMTALEDRMTALENALNNLIAAQHKS